MAPCAAIDAQLDLPPEADRLGVLGHSLGAITALNYALDAAPGRVERMILIDPTPVLSGAPSPRWLTSRPLDAVARAAIGLVTARDGRVRWPARLFDAIGTKAIRERPGLFPADAEHEAEARDAWTDEVAGTRDGLLWLWQEFRDSWIFEERTARRLRWRRPVAEGRAAGLSIIAGWKSTRRHRRAQTQLAKAAGARLVKAQCSGHLVPLTRPDVIAEEMRRPA
jgi:lipase